MATCHVKKPSNFSWVDERHLAGMAYPYSEAHLDFLVDVGIGHLVTLSEEMQPPIEEATIYRGRMAWTLLPVEEFEPPTVRQIIQFIHICEEARRQKYAVGVHCRQGRGRTGVMLACYLVKFHEMAPESAIGRIRLMRPGSVETYEQERVVVKYNDHLRSL